MRSASIANNNRDLKPHNKSSYRRRRLVLVILGMFLLWAGVTLWNQVGKLNARSEKAALLEQKLKETQQAHEDAQREIARLNDPEYVEQKIRKELHFVKQGETLFYVPKEQKK